MIKTILAALIGAVLSGSAAMPAQALNSRTWISGKGIDQTGCGPVATPCRTLQYAHDATSAGGEVDVMDAAGYGALKVSKAINIINDGAGVAGVLSAPGGNEAIEIDAGGNDTIVLRGLTIEGGGTGTGGSSSRAAAACMSRNAPCRISARVPASRSIRSTTATPPSSSPTHRS